jgi:hypothetical protein
MTMTRQLMLAFLLAAQACAQQVTLAWQANAETNVAGYILYHGPAPGFYTSSNNISGRTNTSAVWSNLPPGRSFWAVTAYEPAGIESLPSNEVCWTNRAFAPTGLRILNLSASLQAAPDLGGPWAMLQTVTVPLEATSEQRFYRARMTMTP